AQVGRAGIAAEALHGNKPQNARRRALARFVSGQASVLVATDIAARGIDVDQGSHVINYELPDEVETYVHRIGRTARAGAIGVAVSLCDAAERDTLQAIQNLPGGELTVINAATPAAISAGVLPDGEKGPPRTGKERPPHRRHATAADNGEIGRPRRFKTQ